ncbi:MAG: hypothetical protein M1318_00540 [Firmicutes bacterium]|nr:hypothetical protein [Bacillota bacterium]
MEEILMCCTTMRPSPTFIIYRWGLADAYGQLQIPRFTGWLVFFWEMRVLPSTVGGKANSLKVMGVAIFAVCAMFGRVSPLTDKDCLET